MRPGRSTRAVRPYPFLSLLAAVLVAGACETPESSSDRAGTRTAGAYGAAPRPRPAPATTPEPASQPQPASTGSGALRPRGSAPEWAPDIDPGMLAVIERLQATDPPALAELSAFQLRNAVLPAEAALALRLENGVPARSRARGARTASCRSDPTRGCSCARTRRWRAASRSP
jgi:hypothetical protein